MLLFTILLILCLYFAVAMAYAMKLDNVLYDETLTADRFVDNVYYNNVFILVNYVDIL